MNHVYCLTFFVYPGEEKRFHIGLFRTKEEAECVRARYKREVAGFRDHKCEGKIREVPVIGDNGALHTVYRYAGWNENEKYDEIDVIESDCYVSLEQARAELERAKKQTPRQEWALDCCVIGQCDWQEGFTRVEG